MTDTRPVLVITALDDPTADRVIDQLNTRGVPVVRFDAADFPRDVVMSARFGSASQMAGHLRTPTREVDLSAVRSLYYRRPSGFDFSHLCPQDARFAMAQARYGLGGVLASLPGCRYVNHPRAIADAEFKPAQLAVAQEVGFAIPATLVTNDLAEARLFADEQGRIVYKPLRSTTYAVAGQPRTVWVREIDPQDLDQSVAGTAHLFQALIDKVADLRVTVIGDQVFCVRIDRDGDDLLDWRYDYDRLSYSVTTLPPGPAAAAHAFLKRFGLVFGCFDLALTETGDLLFLECDPNGQWAWLEAPTGLPMTSALADLLVEGTR